jgi:hypothetical protein
MRRVEEEFQTVLVCYRLEISDRRGATPQVDSDDSCSAGRDHPSD